MNWASIKQRNKIAVEDMCKYLADRYSEEFGIHPSLCAFIYDRDKHITVMMPDRDMVVSDNDIMDYLSERWDIFVNVMSDVVGASVKRYSSINWLDGGKFYSSELYGPYDTYGDALIGVYLECFRAVHKRIKKSRTI